ncbi:MAG: hypothetical protein AAGJ40_09090 [Planctomycetota bacterium]
MTQRGIKAGNAYVEIGIRNRIERGAKAVQKSLDGISARATAAGRTLGLIGASVGAPLLAAATKFGMVGDQLDKMSKRTGVGVSALSELGFAAEQSGTNLQQLGDALFRMNRRVANATTDTGPAVRALEELKLSAEGLNGLSTEDRFTALAEALSKMEDPARAAQLGFEIFGDNFKQLQPLINEGAAGLGKLRQEARDLGITLTEEDATAAAEFGDALNRMKRSMGGVVTQIGAALAPALTMATGGLAGAATKAIEFARDNRELVVAVGGGAAAVTGLGFAIVGLGKAFKLASIAAGGITWGIGLLTSPIGIATVAVGGLGFAIYKYTKFGADAVEWLKDRFGPLVDTVKDAMAAIQQALSEGNLSEAWELTTQLMEAVWLDLTSGIQDKWAQVMGYVTDAGLTTAEAIGSVFEALANTLGGMLDAYRSTYDSIFNFTTEKIGQLTGVETIGEASGSAFDSSFGGVKNSLDATVANIRQFGQSMGDAAAAQKEQNAKDRESDRLERRQRLASLRQSLSDSAGTGDEKESVRLLNRPGSVIDPAPGMDDPKIPSQEEFAKQIASVQLTQEPKEEKNETKGTFSAFAAGLMGTASVQTRGEALQERTAKASEEMLAVMKGQAAQPMMDPLVHLESIAVPRQGRDAMSMDRMTTQAGPIRSADRPAAEDPTSIDSLVKVDFMAMPAAADMRMSMDHAMRQAEAVNAGFDQAMAGSLVGNVSHADKPQPTGQDRVQDRMLKAMEQTATNTHKALTTRTIARFA